MIYEYEMACREAMKNGMTEEQYREIWSLFNRDSQKKHREKQARMESPYEFLSIEAGMTLEGEVIEFQIPDESVNVEEECIHKLDLERLQVVLGELEEEDKNFILDYFSGDGKFVDELATKYGLTWDQVINKKKRILRRLREMF